jgi:hypothetical protein
MMRAAWHGDTLAGSNTSTAVMDRRFRLLRRSTPRGRAKHPGLEYSGVGFAYAVTEDTLVLMPTRDGAHLATYIARPVGAVPSV